MHPDQCGSLSTVERLPCANRSLFVGPFMRRGEAFLLRRGVESLSHETRVRFFGTLHARRPTNFFGAERPKIMSRSSRADAV